MSTAAARGGRGLPQKSDADGNAEKLLAELTGKSLNECRDALRRAKNQPDVAFELLKSGQIQSWQPASQPSQKEKRPVKPEHEETRGGRGGRGTGGRGGRGTSGGRGARDHSLQNRSPTAPIARPRAVKQTEKAAAPAPVTHIIASSGLVDSQKGFSYAAIARAKPAAPVEPVAVVEEPIAPVETEEAPEVPETTQDFAAAEKFSPVPEFAGDGEASEASSHGNWAPHINDADGFTSPKVSSPKSGSPRKEDASVSRTQYEAMFEFGSQNDPLAAPSHQEVTVSTAVSQVEAEAVAIPASLPVRSRGVVFSSKTIGKDVAMDEEVVFGAIGDRSTVAESPKSRNKQRPRGGRGRADLGQGPEDGEPAVDAVMMRQQQHELHQYPNRSIAGHRNGMMDDAERYDEMTAGGSMLYESSLPFQPHYDSYVHSQRDYAGYSHHQYNQRAMYDRSRYATRAPHAGNGGYGNMPARAEMSRPQHGGQHGGMGKMDGGAYRQMKGSYAGRGRTSHFPRESLNYPYAQHQAYVGYGFDPAYSSYTPSMMGGYDGYYPQGSQDAPGPQ